MSTLYPLFPQDKILSSGPFHGLAIHESSSEYTLHLGNARLPLTGEEVLKIANELIKVVSYSSGDEVLSEGCELLRKTVKEVSPEDMTGYTIGATTPYDNGMSNDKPLFKLGRQEDTDGLFGYDGGWAFRTVSQACSYLRVHMSELNECHPHVGSWSVYRLKLPTPWDTCTYLHEDGTTRLLLDAEIVEKVQDIL